MANRTNHGEPYVQELVGREGLDRLEVFNYIARKWEYHYQEYIR